MTLRHSILAVATLLISCGPGWSQADNSNRTVDQYSCKEVMRENGSNREVAIAFLHGFILGKSGTSAFNLAAFAKQTDAFLDSCLENPNEKALDAMLKIKK